MPATTVTPEELAKDLGVDPTAIDTRIDEVIWTETEEKELGTIAAVEDSRGEEVLRFLNEAGLGALFAAHNAGKLSYDFPALRLQTGYTLRKAFQIPRFTWLAFWRATLADCGAGSSGS